MVFFGFGMDYVYKSINGGDSWFLVGVDLLDVFINSVVIDFLNMDDVYVGNDLGVYYFLDVGVIWENFSDVLLDVIMVIDLNVFFVNCKLRIVIYGWGIY